MSFEDKHSKKPLDVMLTWEIGNEQDYMQHLVLGLEREITRKVKDIGIKFDGLSIVLQFNPDYYDSLPNYRQQMAFLVHNIVHLVYKHPQRYTDIYDKQIYGIASDLVVNQALSNDKGDNIHLLEGTATIQMFKHFKLTPKESTEYYYYKLLQEANNLPNTPEEQRNSSQQQLADMLSDESSPINHEWDKIDESMQELLSDSMDDKLLRANDELNRRSRGNTPGYFTDMIKLIIESREPVVDWKKELRRFISNSSVTRIKTTIKRTSKRYGTNPGIKIDRLKRILVAVDTSGSVNLDDLAEFFAEIDNIWRANADIHIVECDAAVGNCYKYEGVPPTQISGRGGTDFQPVMDYILDGNFTPDCCIYFTDGYCSAPTEYPDERKLMWIICSNGTDQFAQLPGTVVKMAK